jgi:type IV fimbrial biogenesis protein FimT
MTKPSSAPTSSRQRGASLIECLIGLATAGVALGASLPSFELTSARRHLDGAAAQLETDLHLARSVAVASNRNVRMTFFRDADGSCYVVHSGAADACTCGADGMATCSAGNESVRSVRLKADSAVQLNANVRSIVFDATIGTITPTGTLRLSTHQAGSVHLIVNVMGRTRSCSPGGTVPGHPAC